MRNYIWPVFSLILVAGIQGNLPASLTAFGAKPDLILVVLVAYALAGEPEFGITLGFIAGVIQGCAVGLSLGSFIATRTLTGFLAGLVNTRLFSENPVVPTVSALWLTFVCEGMFLLANPRSVYAIKTILSECILNAILALILYWIMRGFETRRKLSLVNARF